MNKGRKQWTRRNHDAATSEDESSSELSQHDNHSSMKCHMFDGGVVVTMDGYDCLFPGRTNQDRALVWNSNDNDDSTLLGVFDGHDEVGGSIAEHVRQVLPNVLNTRLTSLNKEQQQDVDVVTALKEAFLQVNESLPLSLIGGCTASVVLRRGSKLYVANVGDSVSLVATSTSDNVKLVHRTRQDRPDVPEERLRIESMGGSISSSSSRLLSKDGPGIAMSRCFGNQDVCGVTAEPVVHVIDLKKVRKHSSICSDGDDKHDATSSKHVFCVLATDGLTDCIPPLEILESLAKALFGSDDGDDLRQAAQSLVDRAAHAWKTKTSGSYRDDITLVAYKME